MLHNNRKCIGAELGSAGNEKSQEGHTGKRPQMATLWAQRASLWEQRAPLWEQRAAFEKSFSHFLRHFKLL